MAFPDQAAFGGWPGGGRQIGNPGEAAITEVDASHEAGAYM